MDKLVQMFDALHDADKEIFYESVTSINKGLCAGAREFSISKDIGQDVLEAICASFENQMWAVSTELITMTMKFKSNIPKATDNKPADLRSPV